MEIRRVRPSWRKYGQDAPIEIVTNPNRDWFERLTPLNGMKLARFAVLQTGEILYGDAFHVLHQDIKWLGEECWIQKEGEPWQDGKFLPLVGGSVLFDSKTNLWRVALIQFYGHGREGSIARFKPLSERLTSWHDLVNTLGNDPMTSILPSMLDL